MTVIQFEPRKAKVEQQQLSPDEQAIQDFEGLIRITNNTCLIGLDKTLVLATKPSNYSFSASTLASLSIRMLRACKEVGWVLEPPEGNDPLAYRSMQDAFMFWPYSPN